MTRQRWTKLRRLVVAPVVVLVLLPVVGVGWAYWTAGSAPGGNGASANTTVNQGATPTASAVGSAVTVSWAASTLASGQAVAGYSVKRYDSTTLAAQTILSACTGTVSALNCTENGVPAGTWVYSVTPKFATNWQGLESLKSNAVTVAATDTTAPVNAISLSSVSGGASKPGNTVFYRGAAAGSFALTNAVSDTGSGPASSATAALTGTSTGWTHSPSNVSTPSAGPYVSSAFSWTASTTSAPSETVTGRDVAGNAAITSLSFVDDSTAPSAGTVTYANGYQPGRSVAVTFTTGTESGSGIATRQLQLRSAALTSGTCGAYTAFANVGADTPTSPYTDSQVTNGVCYMYRYVVTDQVGNQTIATSANVSKVDYAGAVNTTAGLLSHWRLGEAATALIASDSFTGTSGTLLTSRAGELGSTWTTLAGSLNTEKISSLNRAFRSGAGQSINYVSGVPASPNYSVEADLNYRGAIAVDSVGVIGRMSTSAKTFYGAIRWTDNTWRISKGTGGSPTFLATSATQPALTIGESYRIRLQMSGTTSTTLSLYVNGVFIISATDSSSPYTAAGRAGIIDGISSATSKTDTTGLHFEDYQVTPATYPRTVDSKGSNTGDYVNGLTMGTAGALAGDANTAAQFDGLNDYVQMTGTTGFPAGATARSVEMWFKTSSPARQVLFSYGTRANDQEFGLWLNAGGGSMTAWGIGSDKTFTPSSAVNDGSWHQVVKTYDGSSITIYIDGVALPSQAATRSTVMDSYGFGIGAIINPADTNSGGFFTGWLDEVSFYTTALNQTTVTNHYALRS